MFRVHLPLGPVLVLAVLAVLYPIGVARQNRLHPRHPWSRRRTWAYIAGVFVTAVALCSSIGLYDRTLFWDHMVQHLLLIMVAASLFAASSPLALAWRATSGPAHRQLGRALRSRVARIGGHPATAFALYGVLVPLTHLTVFYNWAVESAAADDLEHGLFLLIGYLFWRQIFGADPNRYRLQPPIRIALLFLAVPVDTFVGVTLNAETHEIFPALAALHRTWGLSLVADLRTGGVIMWVGGDTLMSLAIIPVVLSWVRREERSEHRVDRELLASFPPLSARTGQPTAGFALGTYQPRRRAGTGAPYDPAGPLARPADLADLAVPDGSVRALPADPPPGRGG